MTRSVVYKVTNRCNGHRYIGVTRFAHDVRWKKHVYNAGKGVKTYLYSALRKYGSQAFSCEPFLTVLDIADSSVAERQCIEQEAPEYNQTNGGEVTVGRRVSKETVERIRRANTGQRRTAQQIQANSLAAIKRYRERPELREQAAERLRRARLLVNEEARKRRVGESARSRIWTDAMRAKLSASRRGIRHDHKTIERIAIAHQKPVECITLATVFDSVSDAAEMTGVDVSSVSKACRGLRASVRGMSFRYV